MRIVLIAPTQRNVLGCGVRALSAFLRPRGHDVKIVFLPADVDLFRDEESYLLARYSYPREVIADVVELCRGADLVGLSLFTCFFEVSVELTAAIRAALPDLPIAWGGVHPTMNPEECLAFADYVCVGEGEDPLADLAERLEGGGDTTTIENIWTVRFGEILRPAVRRPSLDMNKLPPPDMDVDVHYTRDLESKKVGVLTTDGYRQAMHMVRASKGKALRSLVFLGSRGCHLACGYCGNARYRELYGSRWVVNRLSADVIVDQVAELVDRFPFVEEVEFADDDFGARPTADLQHFFRRYPKEVARPFHFLSTPQMIRRDRVTPMKEAGCFYWQMGVQSASREALARYDRPDETEQVRSAAELLHDLTRDGLPPCYHVILDDPFEPLSESLGSLRFVNSLPRPFWLKRSALVPFPGTPIRKRALEAGLLDTATERDRVYRRVLTSPRPTPLNLVWRALSDGAPPEVVERLARSSALQDGTSANHLAVRLGPALDASMARFQQGRRWWNLGWSAVRRKDFDYLESRVKSVASGPKVPTSAPPG